MMKKLLLTSLTLLFISSLLFSQDDLLDELESEQDSTEQVVPNFYTPAFKAMRICNLQSTKVADKGDWYFNVAHRFGAVNEGISTFFGLDNANTKIQMVYGLFNNFQVGVSRESLRRTYAGHMKYAIIKQKDKSPVNVTLYSTININTLINSDAYSTFEGYDRLSYATQVLISRRLNKAVSLEIAPTYIRQNLTYEVGQVHDQFALGLGGRIKINKRSSINFDYAYNFNRTSPTVYKNPLTIGMDIETGGHVFQLLFSNAQSTNTPGFMSLAEGDWLTGEFYFGFNIVRVF